MAAAATPAWPAHLCPGGWWQRCGDAPASPRLTPCTHCRAAFLNFLEEPDTKRLLVFVDGKDLGAVSWGGVQWSAA